MGGLEEVRGLMFIFEEVFEEVERFVVKILMMLNLE